MTTIDTESTLDYIRERRAILAACDRLEQLGYLLGTYGNLSVRVPDGLLITPSAMPYRLLGPEDLMLVSLEGDVLEGKHQPSSETETHRAIYLARPEIGAVAHTHSLHATAVSCMHRAVPVMAEEQAHLVGGEIMCAPYVMGVDHEGLARAIVTTMGDRNAVLMANHGTVSCGRSLDEALVTSQVAERAAHMFLLASAAGGAVPIAAGNVAIERDHFLYKYGVRTE